MRKFSFGRRQNAAPAVMPAQRPFAGMAQGREIAAPARKAFSMIELVITIVLLGIIFAAIPGLLFRAVESDIASLEGEALYIASAKMREIIAQPHNSILRDPAHAEYNGYYVLDYKDYGVPTNPICNGAANTITNTVGIQTILDRIGGPPPKRDARCLNGIKPDLIPATPPVGSLLRGINEYNGWNQTSFSRGYRMDIEVRPLADNHANSADFGDNPNWTDFPASAAGNGDLLLITITVSYVDDPSNIIGVLRYVASNVGKR